MPLHTAIIWTELENESNMLKLAYRMVNIEESLARGQLVRLFDLFQASDCQKHANWRTQGEEINRLKVQSVINHRHLQSKTCH